MKSKRTRKHVLALAILVVLAFGIISTASAAILKSSLYFSDVSSYAAKSTTFDAGYAVTMKGKATKNAGSSANTWYMKFNSSSSPNYTTNGVVRTWSKTPTKTANSYGAYLLYPNSGFIWGQILCYQH